MTRLQQCARALAGTILMVASAGWPTLQAAPLAGVDPPGSIAGVTQDSAGRPLPGVQVVIAALNRGTTTNAQGGFVFQNVRPGRYRLEAILIGYAPEHADVEVPAGGGRAEARFTLHVSAVQLAGLQVTATRGASSAMSAAEATSEVAGTQLQRSVGSTVAQTLSSLPGIAARYGGPANSIPVIRGLTGERILVLQNGERTADLSAASQDHALSVDPLAASRIEVVRGPASLLYGNNALGGVVNVISNEVPTSVPDHVDGYLALDGESATPGAAGSGAATLPMGASLALTAQGGYRHLGDLRVGGGATQDNTYSRNGYGSLGLGYVGAALTGGGSFQSYRFLYGLPYAPDSDEGAVHIRGHREQAQAATDVQLGAKGITTLHVGGTAQFYGHDEVDPDGSIGTSFKLNTETAEATASTVLGRLQGKVGAAGLLKQYRSAGDEALTPAAHENTIGAFAFQELPLGSAAGAPRLQFGGRFDVYGITTLADERFGPSSRRTFGNVSASIGVSVPLGPAASIGLSAARAFRAPTVEELYSNMYHAAVGAYERGDTSLVPETNAGLDAVFRAQSRRFAAQLAAYYNRINGYIAPVPTGDIVYQGLSVPLDVFTQHDAYVTGVEGRVEWEVVPHLVAGAMGDALRGSFTTGEPLPYMPAARLGGSTRWEEGRYSAGAEYRHVFAQPRVTPGEAATDSYELVDLSASARMIAGGRVHTLTLRVDNFLDARFRDAASRIKDFAWNPGRNVSLVYRVLF